MLFLLSSDKKKKAKPKLSEANLRARDLFLKGKFPVVTTSTLDDDRKIVKVLGLVVCRGYESEETFFGMAERAINKDAGAIIGYQENVAFHPDGSRFFTCYGTAVKLEVTEQHPMLSQLA